MGQLDTKFILIGSVSIGSPIQFTHTVQLSHKYVHSLDLFTAFYRPGLQTDPSRSVYTPSAGNPAILASLCLLE